MSKLIKRFAKFWFLLKKRGFIYTYNYLWVYVLYYNDYARDFIARYMPWLYSASPQTIEIEITTRCALRCKMCEHTYWKQLPQEISFEKFKSIIDQLPRLKWIGLTGIGDSFSHKDFINMLSYVKKKNIYVELFDTFFNLNEEKAKALVDLKIDKMIASIDGATKETYEKIRLGSDFQKIVTNVKNLINIKKARKAYFPEMSFHFIASALNLHEMEKYVDFVNALVEGEAVEIFFTKLLHPFEEIQQIAVDIPEDIIKKVEIKGKALNQIIRWNVNVPAQKQAIRNCSAWMIPFVFASGQVVPCCAGNEANQRDFQIKTSLGNVFKDKFSTIWQSDKYQQFRKDIFNNKVPIPCKFCTIYDVSRKK